MEQIAFHEAADLFPLMEGEEYKALFDGGVIMVEPSTHDGFWYCSFYEWETQLVSYSDRPIRHDGIAGLLAFWNAPANLAWRSTPAEPREGCPWTPTERLKTTNSDTVYFIRSLCGGPVKIGRASSPEDRLADIQRMSPFKLHVLLELPGGAKFERELHQRFAHLRSHGEWFQSAPELLDFIKEARR